MKCHQLLSFFTITTHCEIIRYMHFWDVITGNFNLKKKEHLKIEFVLHRYKFNSNIIAFVFKSPKAII